VILANCCTALKRPADDNMASADSIVVQDGRIAIKTDEQDATNEGNKLIIHLNINQTVLFSRNPNQRNTA